MGKGIFDWQQWYWELHVSMLHHELEITGEEMHTVITVKVSVMDSNTVDGLLANF